MAAPSLWDSYLAYLRTQGFDTDEVAAAVLAAYRDDGGPAQLAEHLVDLDEGLQEWRYRHVKMVERTIGDKPGTGGSPGRRTCGRRSSTRRSPSCGPSGAGCDGHPPR